MPPPQSTGTGEGPRGGCVAGGGLGTGCVFPSVTQKAGGSHSPAISKPFQPPKRFGLQKSREAPGARHHHTNPPSTARKLLRHWGWREERQLRGPQTVWLLQPASSGEGRCHQARQCPGRSPPAAGPDPRSPGHAQRLSPAFAAGSSPGLSPPDAPTPPWCSPQLARSPRSRPQRGAGSPAISFPEQTHPISKRGRSLSNPLFWPTRR